MCDGNLYALRQYENEQANADARDEAIEEMAGVVKEKLLSVSNQYEQAFVIGSTGVKWELSDFIADMDINDGLFAEFLKGGDLLKDKLDAQLDVFCEEIATDLIDNMEPPCEH